MATNSNTKDLLEAEPSFQSQIGGTVIMTDSYGSENSKTNILA